MRLGDGLCKVEVLTQIESIQALAQSVVSLTCPRSFQDLKIAIWIHMGHMSGAWSRTTAPSPQQNGPTSEVQTNPVTAGSQCSELAISQTPTNGQSDGQALQTPELSHSVCAMWLWGSPLWERNPRIPKTSKTLSFICPGCLQKSTEVDSGAWNRSTAWSLPRTPKSHLPAVQPHPPE